MKVLITFLFFILYVISLKVFDKFKGKKVITKIAIALFVSVELLI